MDPSPIPLSYQPRSAQSRRLSLGMLGFFSSLIAVVFTFACILIDTFPPETQAQPFWNDLSLSMGLLSIPTATLAALVAPLALYRNPKRLEVIAFILTVIYWAM